MPDRPKSVWTLGAALGEGPVWALGALWFVDIKSRQVHRFDPHGGDRQSWTAPEQIGFLFPARSGGFIAGLQSGLFRFTPEDGRFDLLARVEPDKPSNRLNDGVVDRQGRLWFGTMDDGEKERSGAFYRFEGGAVIPTGVAGIAITNGPAISPDGTALYWVDTLKGRLLVCDIASDGALGPSQALVEIDPRDGFPDGPSVDSEGCIWLGLYSGWEARRYSPQGELLQRVGFPVANITKIAFGGEDLRTAFATTARHKMPAEALAAQGESGDLFQFRVEVAGLPCPLVAD